MSTAHNNQATAPVKQTPVLTRCAKPPPRESGDCKCCGDSVGIFRAGVVCHACGSYVHKDEKCSSMKPFHQAKGEEPILYPACTSCVKTAENRVKGVVKNRFHAQKTELDRVQREVEIRAKVDVDNLIRAHHAELERLAREGEICAASEFEKRVRSHTAELKRLKREAAICAREEEENLKRAHKAELTRVRRKVMIRAREEEENLKTAHKAELDSVKREAAIRAREEEEERDRAHKVALGKVKREAEIRAKEEKENCARTYKAELDSVKREAEIRAREKEENWVRIHKAELEKAKREAEICARDEREKHILSLEAELERFKTQADRFKAERNSLQSQNEEQVASYQYRMEVRTLEHEERMKERDEHMKKSEHSRRLDKERERDKSRKIELCISRRVHSIDAAGKWRHVFEVRIGRDNFGNLYVDIGEASSEILKSLLGDYYPLLHDLISILNKSNESDEKELRGINDFWVSAETLTISYRILNIFCKSHRGIIGEAMSLCLDSRIAVPPKKEALALSTRIHVIALGNKNDEDQLHVYNQALTEAGLLLSEAKLVAALPFTPLTAAPLPATKAVPSKTRDEKFVATCVAMMREKLRLEGELSKGDAITLIFDALLDCFNEQELRFPCQPSTKRDEECFETVRKICDALIFHKNRLALGAIAFANSLKSMEGDRGGTWKRSLIQEHTLMFDGILGNLDMLTRFLDHQKKFCQLFKQYFPVAFCFLHLAESLHHTASVKSLEALKFPKNCLDSSSRKLQKPEFLEIIRLENIIEKTGEGLMKLTHSFFKDVKCGADKLILKASATELKKKLRLYIEDMKRRQETPCDKNCSKPCNSKKHKTTVWDKFRGLPVLCSLCSGVIFLFPGPLAKRIPNSRAECGHILADSFGGPNKSENMSLLHRSCNRSAGTLTNSAYMDLCIKLEMEKRAVLSAFLAMLPEDTPVEAQLKIYNLIKEIPRAYAPFFETESKDRVHRVTSRTIWDLLSLEGQEKAPWLKDPKDVTITVPEQENPLNKISRSVPAAVYTAQLQRFMSKVELGSKSKEGDMPDDGCSREL